MLKVDLKHVHEIRNAIDLLAKKSDTNTALDQLRKSLYIALRLEASTIPPYLVAAWSIQPSSDYQNDEIKRLIMSVAKEEMLHMMGVANIISATGQVPTIATPDIVLDWGKDTLPVGGNLVPQLAPFSMDLLTTLFMEIEKPKDPVHYVVLEPQLDMATRAPQYATIGEFYDAVIELIHSFPVDPFLNGAQYPQVELNYDPSFENIGHEPISSFEIENKSQAIKILNWIIDQGEGTTEGPMDGDDEPAHYYRFAEIYKGGKLISVDKSVSELEYAYDKAEHPIVCDFSKVYEFVPNPKIKNFDPNSQVYKGLKKFNESYTNMFKQLQVFYENGDKNDFKASIRSMGKMNNYAGRLLELGVCPSFEWMENETQLS